MSDFCAENTRPEPAAFHWGSWRPSIKVTLFIHANFNTMTILAECFGCVLEGSERILRICINDEVIEQRSVYQLPMFAIRGLHTIPYTVMLHRR